MKKVAIILCTKNGEEFLEEQLKSLDSQTHNKIDLYIGDDASEDKTIEIIKRWKFNSLKLVELSNNNYNSFQENFISTLSKIKSVYDLYFFCDQDDIWDHKKVTEYIKIYEKNKNQDYLLICSRTFLINSKGMLIGKSPLFARNPCIQNALVQSIAGGNTMAFNHKTKELMSKIKNLKNIVSHDWVIYILVTIFNGKVIYLKHPLTYYRDHHKNVIGSNVSSISRLQRLFMLLRGDFVSWTNKNLSVIDELSLNNDQKKNIDCLIAAKSNRFSDRIRSLSDKKLFRQNMLSNFLLKIAILLRKI